MNIIIADRIALMPTSIFSTMSKMALEYNAVNLGQGFPDFDGPDWIMDFAYQAMKSGKNQYAPSPGIQSLRIAIADVEKEHYDMAYNPDSEITVYAGATEALYCSIMALINPGDEVIMFEPYYDAHQADVILAGGICKYVTLNKPDFEFDRNDFAKCVTQNTKLIIVNTPHNPTGKVFSKDELEFIAKIAIENDLIVISDEVYEFLTYDSAIHIPISTLEGMKERTIRVSSTGKTFSFTGWKIGYTLTSAKLTDAIRKVHQWTTFAVNTPAQHAMAYAFAKLREYLPDFKTMYQYKRDLAIKHLNETNFTYHIPEGSYFIMVDIPKGKFLNDIDAATKLVIDYGVATIPPSVFYSNSNEGETMLRICFAKSDKTIIDGISNMKKV
jgi:N-succinyldiaminopimelate aminotransferase